MLNAYDLIPDFPGNIIFSGFQSILNADLFGSDPLSQIPLELNSRNKSTAWSAMLCLSLSFVLIALSKMRTSRLILIFSRAVYRNNSVEKIVQEEYSLTSVSSFLLLLNFVLTSTILLYLSYLHFNTQNNFSLFFFLPALPLYFVFWPLIWFNIVGFISGDGKLLSENKKNVIVFTQVCGLLFSFLLLIWTFNFKWSLYFVPAFEIIICVFWFYKILRGIIFSFQHGIAWYYIILYLCTLEILPVVLFVTYFMEERSKLG